MNAYLKAIIAVLGTVVTSLAVYYGNESWYPIVVSAVTALTVYLAPNTPKNSVTTGREKSLLIHPSTGIYGNPNTPLNYLPTEPIESTRDDGWDKIHE